MKKFLSIFFILTLLACQGKNSRNTQNKSQPAEKKTYGITEFAFNEEMHNFGSLKSGEIVVYTFVFTNTGDKKLTIDDVVTDCGCVHATYSKAPVAPEKTGLIEVEFDSSGLFGRQFKTIEVHANTKKPKQIAIFAEVQNEQLEIKY
jgi:hypothetical protein